jgi:HK97 family phage major capsid protein
MAKASMEETVVLIQQGLEGIQKNTATKTEVISLIDERVKTDKALLDAAQAEAKAATEGLTKANASIDELKAQAESLKSQLRSFQSGSVKIAASSGRYGIFSNIQEAKAFGLLLMAATTSEVRKAKALYEKAIKSLEQMGIEPRWVNSQDGKVMSTSGQATGSALVTIEQIPSITMAMEEYGAFRRNALNVPMGAASTTMPKIDSLLNVYVPGEGGTITADDPEIAVLTLTPKTMNALTAFSAELDEDSAVGLALLLGPLFLKSFAYSEDLCGYNGDGTATYFGFRGMRAALRAVDATIGNIKSIIVGSGNAYTELAIADFEKVVGMLPQFADTADCKWHAHRYFYYTVMVRIALATTASNAMEVITGANSRQKLFLGYPVDFVQVMPSAEANSQICTLFGDMRQAAMLGNRGGVEFASSSERYFEKGIIAVRGRNRVAISCHGVGSTSAAGPMIGLATAAS